MALLRSRQGAVMVEFIMVFFIIALILFTIVDLGLMLNKRFVLVSAAREGSRIAAVEGGATGAVYDRINMQLEMGGIDHRMVDVNINPKKAGYGSAISVDLGYEHHFITPVIRKFTDGGIEILVSFVTRSENVK
jgi:hypothetical protein